MYELATAARDSGQITNEKFDALNAKQGHSGSQSDQGNSRVELGERPQDNGTGSGRAGSDSRHYSETPAVRNPTKVDNVKAAVSELIGSKNLPNKLGRVVATTFAEIKSYWGNH